MRGREYGVDWARSLSSGNLVTLEWNWMECADSHANTCMQIGLARCGGHRLVQCACSVRK